MKKKKKNKKNQVQRTSGVILGPMYILKHRFLNLQDNCKEILRELLKSTANTFI
jgi:hypothetical protein